MTGIHLSKLIFVSNMFVVCGLDTGLVVVISSVASCTSEFLIEYIHEYIESLLYLSMFSFNLS